MKLSKKVIAIVLAVVFAVAAIPFANADTGTCAHTYGYEKTLIAPGCETAGEKGIYCGTCGDLYKVEPIRLLGHVGTSKTVSSSGNGMEVLFLIDESGSMGSSDGSGIRKQVAKDLTDNLGTNDKAAVVGFESTTRVITGFTSDKDVIKNAIDSVYASGGTDMYIGLDSSLALFSDSNVDKYIILLSDGSSSGSSSTYASVANSKGVVIHTVGLGDYADEQALKEVSDATGGNYYSADAAEDLFDIYEDISSEIVSTELSWITTIRPTCTAAGEKIRICPRCDVVIETMATEALGHDNGVWMIDYEATADHEGRMTRYCTICDAALESKTFAHSVQTHEHTEGHRVTLVAPSCGVAGEKGIVCAECNVVYATETIDALEHSEGHSKVLLAPYCETAGEVGYYCGTCGELYETAEIPALGHSGGSTVVGSSANLEVLFLIDESGSMDWNDGTGIRKEVAKNLTESLGANDKAAVVAFESTPRVVSEFTNDKDVIKNAIDSVYATGGTDMYAGLATSFTLFAETSTARRYIILLTDGESYGSFDYATAAAEKNVVIYTVGLGSSVNSAELTDIAEATGGKYYAAADADALFEIYEEIATEIVTGGGTWVTTITPTCHTAGEKVCFCSRCGRAIGSSSISPVEHIYSTATYTNEEAHTATCANCGEIVNDLHAWSEWIFNGDNTFFKDGTQSRTCAGCNKTETQTAEHTSIIARFFYPCFDLILDIFNLMPINWIDTLRARCEG